MHEKVVDRLVLTALAFISVASAEYSKLGYSGGHTGALSSRFVAAHIDQQLTNHDGLGQRRG